MRRIPALALVLLCACGQGPNRKPQAAFVVTPARPVLGEVARFDGSPSRDRDGRIVEFAFEWGEGTERWSRSPSPYRDHVFQQLGVHWVKLQVTDEDGGRSEAVQPVEVVLIPDDPDADAAGEAEDPGPDADAAEIDADEAPAAGEADADAAGEAEDPEPDAEVEADSAAGEADGEGPAPYSGYISLLESVGKTRDSVQVSASFTRPIDQDCGSSTASEVHEFDDCRVTLSWPVEPDPDTPPCVPAPRISGGLVTIHGALVEPLLLAPTEDEAGRVFYVSTLAGDEVRLFDYGVLLPIEVAGDPEHGVAPAEGALTTPRDFQVLEPALKDSDLAFSPGAPLPVRWSGAIDDGSRRMSIVLTANLEDRSRSFNCYCNPLDSGEFTIPAAVTALIPVGAPIASLMLTRGEHTTLYSEADGRIMATCTLYRGGSGRLEP